MKKIRLLILVLAVLAVAIAGFSSYRHIRHKTDAEAAIGSLPAFSFIRQDGGSFGNADIDASAHRILFDYFNPDCEHCQYMAGELRAHAALFTDYQLILVTTADSVAVARFRKNYGLDKAGKLVLLRDPKFAFDRIFSPSMIPSFYVYGQDGKLIRKIMGETKLENILK